MNVYPCYDGKLISEIFGMDGQAMILASISQPAPLMLGIFIGISLCVAIGVLWGIWRVRRTSSFKAGEPIADMHDEVLIGLMVLAAFAFGAFLTYILLSIRI